MVNHKRPIPAQRYVCPTGSGNHAKHIHIIYMYLQDYYTPLYVASAKGFNDVVKTLIEANANVNCVCKVSYNMYIILE